MPRPIAEINRGAREAEQRVKEDRKLLADVERKITALITAIEDGAYNKIVKSRLDELEAKKIELERHLASATLTPVRIHPKLSEIYRRKVEKLAASLSDDSIRTEASEVLRGLIDKIVLTPVGEDLKAELYGDLAEIVAFAEETPTKSNAPTKGRGAELSVVAGARINLYRQAWRAQLQSKSRERNQSESPAI